VDNVFMRATVADPRMIEATAWAHLNERLTDEDRRDLSAVAVIRKSDAPADEILEYATTSHSDLIVLGTHGREGLSHLLTGSVAERVVRNAACPVLTLKHPHRNFVTEAEAAPSTAV
jgi:nucleotide-binding universal stress UspA family protein